jgi:hypothetical protein
MIIGRELLGMTVSVVVGTALTEPLQQWLDAYVRLPERTDKGEAVRRIPPDLTGTLERILFTLLIAFDISGTATAMIAWTGAKMLANWNSPEAAKDNPDDNHQSALLGPPDGNVLAADCRRRRADLEGQNSQRGSLVVVDRHGACSVARRSCRL